MNALIIISLLGILVLFLGLYKYDRALLPVTLAGLTAALAVNLLAWNTDLYYYNEMMRYDNFAVAFSSIGIISTILILLLSGDYFQRISTNVAEYYAIMLFSLAGVICMVSYQNLAMLFIGLEILSVCMYILCGIKKKDTASNEAALKYFLMGAFATGILLFGIALVYGATGSFNIDVIGNYASAHGSNVPPLFLAGILLMLVGLGFKVSAAPFHFWTPDVYQGAPNLITAYMATVVKTAGFAGFLRLFMNCFAGAAPAYGPTLWAITALTITVGNIAAVYQDNFKRMLAWSSISHAGYMLLAILAIGASSSKAIFIYALAYSIASIIAFAVLIRIRQTRGNEQIESFNGLAKTNPLMAFALTLAMCSLAGIPLTAGFFGKFFIFFTALAQDYLWLVIIAIVNAAIGIYYYFRVIIAMYMKEGSSEQVHLNGAYKTVLYIGAAVTLLVGIFPHFLSDIL